MYEYRYAEHCETGRTELTEDPGTSMKVVHNSQKSRVSWHGRTELTEAPGRYTNGVPVPRVFFFGRTELTEAPGTGMKVARSSHNFRVL